MALWLAGSQNHSSTGHHLHKPTLALDPTHNGTKALTTVTLTASGPVTRNCFWFDFNGNQDVGPNQWLSYVEIMDNRDLWIAFVGVNRGLFQWGLTQTQTCFPMR